MNTNHGKSYHIIETSSIRLSPKLRGIWLANSQNKKQAARKYDPKEVLIHSARKEKKDNSTHLTR